MYRALAWKDLFHLVSIFRPVINLLLVFQNSLLQRYILVSLFCGIENCLHVWNISSFFWIWSASLRFETFQIQVQDGYRSGSGELLGPPWEGSFSEQSVSGWALALRGSQGQPLPLGCRMLRELSVPMITSGYSDGDELYLGPFPGPSLATDHCRTHTHTPKDTLEIEHVETDDLK